LLTNLLNPKIGVFYVSFLPQFIPAGVQVWSFSMLLASIHATQGILWFLLITNAAEFFSIWLRRRRVVMALDSAMGAVFIAFGLKLAFDKSTLSHAVHLNFLPGDPAHELRSCIVAVWPGMRLLLLGAQATVCTAF
jgi:hypothetical protein